MVTIEDFKKQVNESDFDKWFADSRKGLHCAICNEQDTKRLLNNPMLPLVCCIKCFGEAILWNN